MTHTAITTATTDTAVPPPPPVSIPLPAVPSLPADVSSRRPPATRPAVHHTSFRSVFESIVCLLLAVILFRTFAAEGYMISTGSMAPALLGFHKRIECPRCHHRFAFGTAYDTDADSGAAAAEKLTICPACGQSGIDVEPLPRNHGDQLLVNKLTYQLRDPDRWEIAVFRNPGRSTEAYVKRVIGRPGETIQLVDGDVLINGEVARKSLAEQHELRILVADSRHLIPDDASTHGVWQIGQGAGDQPPAVLGPAGLKLQTATGAAGRVAAPAELRFRYRMEAGGQHETRVPLVAWPEDVVPTQVPRAGLRFDPDQRTLACTGVLSRKLADQIIDLSQNVIFRDAVDQLQRDSHWAPVPDSYGYNPPGEHAFPAGVRDLALSMRWQIERGQGRITIIATDGEFRFRVLLDTAKSSIALFENEQPLPIAESLLPSQLTGQTRELEVSLFDQQVLVALDQRLVLPAFAYRRVSGTSTASREPFVIAVDGLDLQLESLVVHRDVYYTRGRARHAVTQPLELGPDEFFMAGDNSPLSHDSRRWESPGVPRHLLIGQPFLVHLPSRPGLIRWAGRDYQLRLPDWERIRWLGRRLDFGSLFGSETK